MQLVQSFCEVLCLFCEIIGVAFAELEYQRVTRQASSFQSHTEPGSEGFVVQGFGGHVQK